MATPFKLKSGNASAFKNLGSSPMKEFNMTGSIKAGEKIVSKVDVANALKVKTQNFRDAANKIKTVSSKTNKGSKVIQALKNTPKQYIKPAEEILKTTNRNMISASKQVAKKIKPSRAIPVIGEALMTYDVLREGVRRVVTKSDKLQLPEAKATKFSGGKTWKEAKEGGKSDIWNKKK